MHRDDLIDDRSLKKVDDDAFRLRDVVEEVAAVCASTPTPATVGLYGSWGSGKSSLGNLLGTTLKAREEIAFARFDAFKYAEVPLRRHFLSQVAYAFEIKDKKFHEELYSDHKEVGLRIPRAKWLSLLLVVAVSVVVITLLSALSAVVIAWMSEGDFHANFTKTLSTSLPGIALATPLLAAAIALVGQHLTAETTTKAPSSEEQFEKLFRSLVTEIEKKERCERIVIFIDELDRCSPRQVVSALETLRTFLEIPSCVFVVAADQQVLEHALTRAARQSTPFNPANPYYSAGSAYLDKIFQYQLQLPPVLPRRLSRYALELIENRQGVWAKVTNRAELVSVLVPTHVTSPRRVKALLNSFALLYRLALRRASENAIEANIETRVAEIAKLACLRTEFPLFAADFQLDARLPDLVLYLREHTNLREHTTDSHGEIKKTFPGLSHEAYARALAYAMERLPTDEVIAREPQNAPAAPSDDDGDKTAVEQVESSQARQLIRYLERTRKIQCPRRDLVYLESSGAAFELPAQLAEQIERDAIDGLKDAVVQAVEQITDEGEQLKAYRLLARLVIESVGIESQNVVRSLFGAMSVAHGELDAIADGLLNSLVTYSAGYDLEADDLLPALRLALSHSGKAAQDMRMTVLKRKEMLDDDDLAQCALEHLSEFPRYQKWLGEVLVAMLERGAGVRAERALGDASESKVSRLVDDLTLENDEAFKGLVDFLGSAKENGREELAQCAFKRLLDSEGDPATEAALSVVGRFAPIADKVLAPAIVKYALARPVAEWGSWLGALDATVVQQSGGMADTIGEAVQRLWQERFAVPLTRDDFSAIASELGRLRPDQPSGEEEPVDLLEGASPEIAPPMTAARTEQYDELWVLANVNALSWEAAGSSMLNDLIQTLTSPQGASYPAPVLERVLTSTHWGLSVVPADAVARFLSAVEGSAWLDATAREILRVQSACALRRLSADTDPPADETLTTLAADPSAATDEALAEWITTFVPEPTRVFDTLAPRLADGQRLASALREAIVKAAAEWSSEQKSDLLRAVADQYRGGDLHDSVLRAADIGDADPDKAGAVLIEAYESSKNNDQRGQAMALWSLVDPGPDRVRRRLIGNIYLPLLNEGKGATRIALGHFALVRSTRSQATQQRLKTAIRAAAEGDRDLAKKADRLLREAGWIKSKRKLLPWS